MQADIRDYGAVDGATPHNTKAIQSAIDDVARTGGRIVVPPGTWRSGTLYLRSHTELHLAPGAVLLGTNNPDDYPRDDPVKQGLVVSRRAFDRRMVYGCDVENVAVTGQGTIDGDGGCADMETDRGHEGRPNNLQFVKCRGVTVRDIHLRSAGSWMQQYLACEDLHIHAIRVWNHGNKTNDGLDIDGCTDVRISDCDIDSHDDALVFKSTGPQPCRNIVVTGCRLRSNCHGIKFGTESVGGFENIRVADCIITPSRLPDPLPDHPEGRPVITGCAIECVDGGKMRGISISGLIVERVFAPIFIKLGERHDRRVPGEDFTGAGCIEDIQIINIIARRVGPIACSITGYPDHPVRRVQLANINIEHCGGITADQVLHPVPEKSTGYPEVNMFGRGGGKRNQLPAWGLFARHVEDLTLRDIHMRLLQHDARQPIVTDDVTGLELSNVSCHGQRDADCVLAPASD